MKLFYVFWRTREPSRRKDWLRRFIVMAEDADSAIELAQKELGHVLQPRERDLGWKAREVDDPPVYTLGILLTDRREIAS